MIKIAYTPKFIKQLKNLEEDLREEAIEKIDIFAADPKYSSLKTHKLKGRLKGKLSFSVNYKTRIVFQFLQSGEAILLLVGDHDVYK